MYFLLLGKLLLRFDLIMVGQGRTVIVNKFVTWTKLIIILLEGKCVEEKRERAEKKEKSLSLLFA